MADVATEPIDSGEETFDEEKFTEHLCQSIKDCVAEREEFDKLVDQWYKDWRDIKDTKLFPWRGCSNWSVPVSSTSADSVIPRIVEGIFDLEPPLDAMPMNSTAAKFRDVIRGFLLWDMETHPEIYQQIWYFIQNTVWGGTGFIKSCFVKEKRTEEQEMYAYVDAEDKIVKDGSTDDPLLVNDENTQRLAQAGVQVEIKEVTRKKKRWHKYHPELVSLDIKDVIVPSDSESIQDAWDNSWIAVRQWRTKDFLRRQLEQEDNELYDKLNKVKIKDLEPKLKKADDERDRKEINKFGAKTKKIEVFEVYINWDIDNDGLEEKVVAILNLDQKLLFGKEKYPYDHGKCPIIPGYIKPIHKQVFGVGLPEMLFDTKGEIDKIHNQRTDRGDLHNAPILTHTEASGFDPTTHKLGPGRQWRLTDRSENAIGYMASPSTSRERISHEEEQLTLAYGQKRSGVTDYALGSESDIASNKTATGIMALIEEGNVGFRHFIRWISLSVKEIFQQRFDLFQQYWGKQSDEEVESWIKQILDIPGNPLSGQDREAIKQKFNIVMTASKKNKNIELKKAQVGYEIVSNSPLIQQSPVHLREITLDLLRAVGINEPEKKVPSGEELKQMQVDVQKEAMRQLETEKSQQNLQEAGDRGYETEKVRLEAQNAGR